MSRATPGWVRPTSVRSNSLIFDQSSLAVVSKSLLAAATSICLLSSACATAPAKRPLMRFLRYLRPSHLPRASRLRSRAALSFATSLDCHWLSSFCTVNPRLRYRQVLHDGARLVGRAVVRSPRQRRALAQTAKEGGAAPGFDALLTCRPRSLLANLPPRCSCTALVSSSLRRSCRSGK
jgi:hypothetical protein